MRPGLLVGWSRLPVERHRRHWPLCLRPAVGRRRAAGLGSRGSRARRATAEGAEARKSRRRHDLDLQARRVSREKKTVNLD